MIRRGVAALALSLFGCASTPPPVSLVDAPAPAPTRAPGADAPDVAAAIARAERALADGDPVAARLAIEDALARDPRSVRAHYYAGVAHEKLGQPRDAERSYRKVLALAPSFPEAAINLGAILIDSGRAPEAMEVLVPAVEAWPDDPLLAENLGLAASMAGDAPTAVRAYERRARLGPLSLETRMTYADALIALKRRDEAATLLRAGLAAVPEDRDIQVSLASLLAGAGAYDDAIALVTRAISAHPSAELLVRRALFRRGKRDVAAARADLQAAILLDPKLPVPHLYLGELFGEAGDPVAARRELSTARQLASDGDPIAVRARVLLEKLEGKPTERR